LLVGGHERLPSLTEISRKSNGIRWETRNLLNIDHGKSLARHRDPYVVEHASWLKIRNREYSQWVGREELFERERGRDPDFQVWDSCALACDELVTV